MMIAIELLADEMVRYRGRRCGRYSSKRGRNGGEGMMMQETGSGPSAYLYPDNLNPN
jgi:hypothetical protein